jgi:NADPH-dependent glutamate synthase beta subunit-like oxidoreductase
VPGIHLLLDFMRLDRPEGSPDVGAHVVIAGGGNAGLDGALMAQRMGADNVTVLFREAPDDLEVDDAKLTKTREAGIIIKFKAAVTAMRGSHTELKSVEITDLTSHQKTTQSCSSLLLAAGRLPELIIAPVNQDSGSQEAEQPAGFDGNWEARTPYKDPAFYDEEGLLAAGDALSDFSGAIRAIGAGRRAAASIHSILHQLPMNLPVDVVRPGCAVQNVDQIEEVTASSRGIMPLNPTADPTTPVDLEEGFSEDKAMVEAKRCLQCGLICYEHSSQAGG